MVKFVSGLQVDKFGNSVPGAYPLTPEQQAEVQLAEIQASRLGSIAASAEDNLRANPTDVAALDRFCQGRGFSISQAMAVKHAVLERGMGLDAALKRNRL